MSTYDRKPLHLAKEDLTCKHCGAECYWQEVITADGTPKARLFEDGKPHICKPSTDDFEVLPVAPGVPVAPETLANNSPCQPDGLMFDALGNPRERYVRVTFDGSHMILPPAEAEVWKYDAEASAASIGQTDPHTYSDVYLSKEEADALPEFDGF